MSRSHLAKWGGEDWRGQRGQWGQCRAGQLQGILDASDSLELCFSSFDSVSFSGIWSVFVGFCWHFISCYLLFRCVEITLQVRSYIANKAGCEMKEAHDAWMKSSERAAVLASRAGTQVIPSWVHHHIFAGSEARILWIHHASWNSNLDDRCPWKRCP